MNSYLLSLAFLATSSTLGGDDPIPFADFGKSMLARHGKNAKAEDVPIDSLREKQFVHGALGFFDIAYPAWELGDKQRVEDFKAVATVLVQIQVHWIDWCSKGDAASTAAKNDAKTVIEWIKSWKPAAFAKASTSPERDLYALIGATDAQKQASKHLGTSIGTPDMLGLAPREEFGPMHIMFAPTRHDLVELLGYAGLVDPARQKELWNRDATSYTTFWIGWNFVLALEYSPWEYDKEFKTGLSMNKFEATGMLEHTVQQVTQAFVWSIYGDSDALYMNQAQAMMMAIEICGEINAVDGDGGRASTGAHTDPYEKFVPGGLSSGGILPAIPAAPLDTIKTNPWHEGAGKDAFAAPLRKGQKAGLKQMGKDSTTGIDPAVAKDKNAHFLLGSRDGTKHWAVSAPFLGLPSKAKRYPDQDYIFDYKEFFRAYKCGFYHWLQTQGDKAGAEPSTAKFRELMHALAAREEGQTQDDVVLKVYGVALSAKNGETDSLEWRFLDWLAKGK